MKSRQAFRISFWLHGLRESCAGQMHSRQCSAFLLGLFQQVLETEAGLSTAELGAWCPALFPEVTSRFTALSPVLTLSSQELTLKY